MAKLITLVSAAVQRQQPQWRSADPADIEAWVIELPIRLLGMKTTVWAYDRY